jgi:transcriptional regulator with XRE-family HTH domain
MGDLMKKDWIRTEFKLIRKEAGVSAKTLASRTGTGMNTIYNFEKGRTNPALETFEKWLNELGHELEILQIDPEAPSGS